MAATDGSHISPSSILNINSSKPSEASRRLILNHIDNVPPSPSSSPPPSPNALYANWLRGGLNSPTNSARLTKGECMTMHVLMGPEDDFDSLPPALRRKYFSTLERLRLAQNAGSPTSLNGRLSRSSSTSIAKATRGKPRPTLDRRSTYVGRSPSRRLRKSESVRGDHLVSQVDAQWFLALPEKIQRRHFTREEQKLLAGNRNQDSVILDAADEVLYRKRRQATSSFESVHDSILDSCRSSVVHPEVEEETPVDSAVDMDDAMHDSFRWLDEEEDLDLSLDDYHTHIAQAAERTTTPTVSRRKPSFRRTISLTSLQFGRNSSSSNRAPQTSQSSTVPLALPQTSHRRSNSRPLSTVLSPRHTSHASISSIDPSAKHYQDPEARLKLRVYLASPQKFDEAIEFGFPSVEDKENIHPPRPPTMSRKTDNSAHTFLAEDTASLFDDDGADNDDDTSVAESDSPKTPLDAVFRPADSGKQSSIDKPSPVKPHILNRSPEHYPQASTASREMTLHMTLTRPDLRTADENAQALQRDDDPLKLADLPQPVSHAIWDTMPADSSKMKKMWRKLRRRS